MGAGNAVGIKGQEAGLLTDGAQVLQGLGTGGLEGEGALIPQNGLAGFAPAEFDIAQVVGHGGGDPPAFHNGQEIPAGVVHFAGVVCS